MREDICCELPHVWKVQPYATVRDEAGMWLRRLVWLGCHCATLSAHTSGDHQQVNSNPAETIAKPGKRSPSRK